jgi:hypothetical protein
MESVRAAPDEQQVESAHIFIREGRLRMLRIPACEIASLHAHPLVAETEGSRSELADDQERRQR